MSPEELARESGEPGLRVPVGRGGVAIHGPEVALSVYERVAERKLLRHADERIVDGRIAVRVVFADHVADDGGALAVGPGRAEAGLVHRVQDPPVDRLQAVADIGQGALHDDAHRVVDERFAHLFFERSLLDAFYTLGGHGFPLETGVFEILEDAAAGGFGRSPATLERSLQLTGFAGVSRPESAPRGYVDCGWEGREGTGITSSR